MKIEDFLELLEKPKRSGRGWLARCPAHSDDSPSLSIGTSERGILIRCHAGCTAREVTTALGVSLPDLFWDSNRPTGYSVRTAPQSERPQSRAVKVKKLTADWRPIYERAFTTTGESLERKLGPVARYWGVMVGTVRLLGAAADGRLLYFPMQRESGEVVGVRVTTLPGPSGKKMRPWALQGSHVGVFADIDRRPGWGRELWIAEGLSDAATMLNAGLEAIGRPSATSGTRTVLACCRKRHVIVVADNDKPGLRGAESLAYALRRTAWSVRVMTPPIGKDLREWFSCGGTAAELADLARSRRAW